MLRPRTRLLSLLGYAILSISLGAAAFVYSQTRVFEEAVVVVGFDNLFVMEEILKSHGVIADFPNAGNFGASHFYAVEPAELYRQRLQILNEASDRGIFCGIYFVPKWGKDWTVSMENSLPGKPGLK